MVLLQISPKSITAVYSSTTDPCLRLCLWRRLDRLTTIFETYLGKTKLIGNQEFFMHGSLWFGVMRMLIQSPGDPHPTHKNHRNSGTLGPSLNLDVGTSRASVLNPAFLLRLALSQII